jgi:hypothetical protein
MMLTLAAVMVTATGCKAPPEAPETLDELCGYLFAHMTDEEPDALVAGTINLDVWMRANLDATLEGYAIQNISAEAAAGLGKTDGLDGLVGAAVGAESVNPVADVTRALVYPQQQELYPGTYLTFERTVTAGSYACFEAQTCDWLATTNTLTSSYPLGLTVDSHYIAEYRWIEVEGRMVSVYRTYMTEPAEVSLDFLHIPEQFYLGVNMPHQTASHTLRLLATWIVAEIGESDVPESLALNMVIDSLITSNDTWIAANP